MTFSRSSSPIRPDEDCPDCGGPMTLRPLRKHPVILQVTFVASFVVFLLTFDRLSQEKVLLWGWTAVQMGLGWFLIRARILAQKRVYRCVRCSAKIR